MKWCIGIDLGGTFIKFTMLDAELKPTEVLQVPTPDNSQDVVKHMVEGAQQLMQQHSLAIEDITGVGVGSPGPLKISEGVIIALPNIPGMENLPLRDLVSEGLSLPVVLENDANAAAYGEYLCGAGKNSDNMVLLTLGTGVGSGVIINGKILHGAHEIGAEFGHMVVEPEGEKCNCGQNGCLERYCSATYIAQYVTREITDNARDSSLKAVLVQKGAIDAKDINDARKSGDKLADEAWNRCAYYLALACVNICRIIDPDLIVLAGGMTKAGEDLMKPVREHFQKLHWQLTEPMTKLALAELGNDAGAIGAAGVAWQAFEQIK